MRYMALFLALCMTLGGLTGCVKAPKQAEPGGTEDLSDMNAPKTVSSKDIVSFSCKFRSDDRTMAIWSEFTATLTDDEVTVTAYGLDHADTVRFDEERTETAQFMASLQEWVEEYGVGELNGTYVKTNGVPPRLGTSIEIGYASGESISVYDNTSQLFRIGQMEALYTLFSPTDLIEKKAQETNTPKGTVPVYVPKLTSTPKPAATPEETETAPSGTPEPNTANENNTEEETGMKVTFSALPQTLEEFSALPQMDLTKPENTAAMFLCALNLFVNDRDAGVSAINLIKGPEELSTRDIAWLKDRLSDKLYLPLAYFEGATPKNNYSPNEPYTLVFSSDPRPQDVEKGYMRLFISTTGADSPRSIKLREHNGNWYLWEYPGILVGIRKPASEDPWA